MTEENIAENAALPVGSKNLTCRSAGMSFFEPNQCFLYGGDQLQSDKIQAVRKCHCPNYGSNDLYAVDLKYNHGIMVLESNKEAFDAFSQQTNAKNWNTNAPTRLYREWCDCEAVSQETYDAPRAITMLEKKKIPRKRGL